MKGFFSILASVLALSVLAGCGTAGIAAMSTVETPEKFVLAEPEYLGDDEGGDPRFKLSWPKVKDSLWYEVYIYSEVDGSRYQERITPSDNTCTLTFLDFKAGFDTDTADYSVKVRPRYSGNDVWSNLWRIDFVDGEYTMTTVEAEAPQTASAPDATPKAEPLPQTYPAALTQFQARLEGLEDIDVSDVVTLNVGVNHCEYGEPPQEISDPAVVSAVLDAVDAMTVTGLKDEISSTGTYYAYSFYDGDGEYVFGFSIQDGLLMGSDGRYALTGLDALFAVEGIKLAEDWEDYWALYSGLVSDYEQDFKLGGDTTVFDAGGYYANAFARSIDSARLLSVTVRGDEHRGIDDFVSDDPTLIRNMFYALSQADVTGEADGGVGQDWRVTFAYNLPEYGYSDTVSINFTGNCLESSLGEFNVDGLDAFFDCAEDELLTDLHDNRAQVIPIPQY